jgi:hypothetical protein
VSETVETVDPLRLAKEWRLQRFGKKALYEVADPLVEPLWSGPRVFGVVTAAGATLVHDGEALAGPAEVVDALGTARQADGLVLEGVLSQQALSTGEGAYTALDDKESNPGFVSRLIMPGGRKREQLLREKEQAAKAVELRKKELEAALGERSAFVATDLLWLDGEALLDVPLLERKRLLEAVLGESELVRRTSFVRPTAGGSLIAWRALGFAMLAYKAANSRYRPGEVNDAWATAPAPSASSPRPSGGSSTS